MSISFGIPFPMPLLHPRCYSYPSFSPPEPTPFGFSLIASRRSSFSAITLILPSHSYPPHLSCPFFHIYPSPASVRLFTNNSSFILSSIKTIPFVSFPILIPFLTPLLHLTGQNFDPLSSSLIRFDRETLLLGLYVLPHFPPLCHQLM